MSAPRTDSAGPAVVIGVGLVVVLGVVAPTLLAFLGVMASFRIEGVPTPAEQAATIAWEAAAVAVATAAAAGVIAVTVVHRRRLRVAGFATLVVLSVIGCAAAGFWLLVAVWALRA